LREKINEIIIYIHNIQYSMNKIERGIRVPEKLKNKIKLAATVKNMSMVQYLDSVVPDMVVEEKK
jgi:hypothetical protein